MSVKRLKTHRVEKPWGRHSLWPGFADPAPGADPIGEIWFQDEGDAAPELLVKYLFTSEKLSIQVHPDDESARAAGYDRGKDEAWVILAAEPDSTIAIGTHQPIDQAHLRAAALDGSIEQLVDWKPVKAGDVYYSPARTVHAIGAGITVVEVQQNVDLTYRLYDYGRPRELHLDEGVKVSDAVPFVPNFQPEIVDDRRTILAEGPKFVLERWSVSAGTISLPADTPGWFVPLTGHGALDGQAWHAGECWALEGKVVLEASADADMLFAYPLARRVNVLSG
ncbi:class I mannose-6-phosphate isomerase [Sphingobium boeckii]|uniref:Mannose-6-phosphate isomerase n=1 Tax=Sphingobium boeckii TaxID=1082345 RepID=A0A7W9AIN9_9SPHN|nr:class I mannose-6-phosphate isomerase [Sphingobium boeckii]MBB5686201.1 mannose-6-phosphate isomerase [Sphingobium boeckii]